MKLKEINYRLFENFFSFCYSKREDMISDCSEKATIRNKIKFRILSYFADKF